MITVWKETHDQGITYPEGFVAAAARGGFKTQGDDIALIVSESAATAAGVFTTNRVQASSVRYSRRVVRTGSARAIVCNAGNANACNGDRGEHDTRETADIVARKLNIAPSEVVVASTGVIGHPLPMDKMAAGIAPAVEALAEGPDADMCVAHAIMTTDTRAKSIAVSCDTDHWVGAIRFGGVCKGSGMIAPNMATMLCFITTDVQMPAELLQRALSHAVERTFNHVTVDSDTSTNDMCVMMASGMGACRISVEGAAYDDFCEAVYRVCLYLAKEVARDGEGATKLAEIVVRGASTRDGATRIARTIAESPLVKTALYGNDPNWGRILAAAGRAGVAFDPESAEVLIGDYCVCRDGGSVDFDAQAAHAYLASPEVRIVLDLHVGDEECTFWTCDYSYDYIKINAEYHT